jgi:hypothetical protein
MEITFKDGFEPNEDDVKPSEFTPEERATFLNNCRDVLDKIRFSLDYIQDAQDRIGSIEIIEACIAMVNSGTDIDIVKLGRCVPALMEACENMIERKKWEDPPEIKPMDVN